jgi:hypothetical protein
VETTSCGFYQNTMMGKQMQPNIKIQNILDSSNLFYQDLLGYKPEQTSLEQIPESQWNEFAQTRGLNPNSSGIYLPRNQTAIIQGENLLSLFHEYFGHGLYCEQNLTGRKLVDLEKRLLKEEKQEFSNSRFSLEDIQKFRQQNKTFQELESFKQENLGRYELFSIWTEYLLSGENGLNGEFGRKYDSLLRQEKEAVDSITNFSGSYGNLATMYAQGMARKTTPERVKRLLKDLCRQKLDSIKLGILFGSKNQFSDIDLYLISDEIEPFSSDWIDTRVHTQKRFEEGIRNFDVRVTDPLFSGEFVFGNKKYFEQQKQILGEQQITKDAINYNLQKSEDYRNLQKGDFELCDQVENSSSYAETYLANALALRQGKRFFTKEDLPSYFRREKQIQLKGGTEKNAT